MRLMPLLLLLALSLCLPVCQSLAADGPGTQDIAGPSPALTSGEFLRLIAEPLDAGDVAGVVPYIKGNPRTALQTAADLRLTAETAESDEEKAGLLELAVVIESLVADVVPDGKSPEKNSPAKVVPKDACEEQYDACLEKLTKTCMDETFPAACIKECLNKYGFGDDECRNDLCLPNEMNLSNWHDICADRVKEKSGACDQQKALCGKTSPPAAPK